MTLSKPLHNKLGLKERELTALGRTTETGVGLLKLRRITELSLIEKADLILAVVRDFATHADAAQRFRVSKGAVGAFIKKVKQEPLMLDTLMEKEQSQQLKREAVRSVVEKLWADEVPLGSACVVRAAL